MATFKQPLLAMVQPEISPLSALVMIARERVPPNWQLMIWKPEPLYFGLLAFDPTGTGSAWSRVT